MDDIERLGKATKVQDHQTGRRNVDGQVSVNLYSPPLKLYELLAEDLAWQDLM